MKSIFGLSTVDKKLICVVFKMSLSGWAIAPLEDYQSNAILDRAAIWISDNNSAFKST